MNREFKSFIINSLISSITIFTLFLTGFILVLSKKNIEAGNIFAGSSIVIVILLLASFFSNALKNLSGSKAIKITLITSFVLFLVAMLITLIYAICILAGANMKAADFCAASMGIGFILAMPLAVVSIIYLLKYKK